MNEFQTGDEVEFLVIECYRCKNKKPFIGDKDFYYFVNFGDPEGFVCSDCAVTEEDRLLPATELLNVLRNEPPAEPLPGAFKPLPSKSTSDATEQSPFWIQAGERILEIMLTWHGKVLKFSIGTEKHKGLWVKPIWDGSTVAGLELAGDTPSKGLELDVYQTRRLSQLGFTEEGKTNKTWSLSFEPHEKGIANSSSVITYILRHGYLLDIQEVTSLTPTLDVDFKAPEYQHLKSKKR